MELRSLLEDKGFFRIPLKKLSSTHYLVRARIHNIEARLILDTGASTTCIDIQKAQHFEILHEKSDMMAAGAGSIGMKMQISYKNKLQIGSWVDSHIGLVLFDLSHINIALNEAGEESVDGILGADFLKKHRAVIDYGRNCLYLKEKKLRLKK